MDNTLVAAFVALTGAVIYHHLRVFSFWSSRGIPGPRPWPIFGTSIYYIFKNKIDQDTEWRQKYGHTYGLFEGYSPLLKTTDNELIKHIFIKNFHSFTDRNTHSIEGDLVSNMLFWSKGERWANQRALVSPMFSSSKIKLMFSPMSSCIDRFIGHVNEEKKQSVLSKSDTSQLTLDVIASCLFGLKLNTYDSAKNQFLRAAYNSADLEIWWFVIWLMTPKFLAKLLELNQFRVSRLDYFSHLTQQVINERRRAKDASPKSDVIQMFMDAKLEQDTHKRVFSIDDDKEAHYNDFIGSEKLEAQQQKQTSEAKLFKRFTDVEIKGQMVFMFLAGFETTSTTISFALLVLAQYPQIQTQLHAELCEKFNCSSEELAQFDFATQAEHSDFLDLKLLDAFLSESLRIFSPILDHNRMVTEPEGVVLESVNIKHKFKLPQGTAISVNGFVLQRDPDYFDKPDEFNLMRFHPDQRDKIKSGSYMPFGLGPRYCAGMRFALMEVKLALAKIIAKCHIAKGSESQEYPPKFSANFVFLQAQDSSFKLLPRVASI